MSWEWSGTEPEHADFDVDWWQKPQERTTREKVEDFIGNAMVWVGLLIALGCVVYAIFME